MAQTHSIRLKGPGASKEGVSAHLFRDLLDVLVEGAERALRFRIEGRSTAQGTPPRWLRPAADFVLLRVPELPASQATIQAPSLLSTMPERFHQGELYADLDPNKSPIEFFEDALEDALAGNKDSDRFDAGLVRTFEKFGSVLQQGVAEVELVNGRVLRIDRGALEKVEALARHSFAPQRVRVAGRLEAIRYSDCRFTLLLASGAELAGTATELGQDLLRNLFGRAVVVTGMAVFRPSGRPLRIEADTLELASERDTRLWSQPPKPLLGPSPMAQIREDQRGKGGLGALLGRWPGDESDEQVAAALESLS